MKIGIAGAGIMGQLLAFACIQEGWEVSLFDPEEKNINCSMAAAGLLTPVAELEKADPIIYHLGVDAIQNHWPTILKKLPGFCEFQCQGSVLLSHYQDRSEMNRLISIIQSQKISLDINKLEQKDIASLEPDLEKFQEGYFFANEGYIDSQTVLQNLKKFSLPVCKKILIEQIQPGKLYSKNLIENFDLVIDCRGLGAKKEFADLRGVRGELLWVQTREVKFTRPIRFLHPRYRLYIVPRPNHIYIIGASEIDAEDDSDISVKTCLELLTTAYSIHPSFAEARILNAYTQCRPTFPDQLPRIFYNDAMLLINGLYRHGYLIAPTLMHEVVNWIKNGSVKFPQLWERKS